MCHSIKDLPAHLLLCFYLFFQSAFTVFGPLHIRMSSLLVLLLVFLKPNVPSLFPLHIFIFMFLTAGHPSTPFWCFAVLESSSHPPARNLLCAHRTEMASARRRGRDEETVMWWGYFPKLTWFSIQTMMLHLKYLNYWDSWVYCRNLQDHILGEWCFAQQ